MRGPTRRIVPLLTVLAGLWFCPSAWGDVVWLRGGGEVRGRFENSPASPLGGGGAEDPAEVVVRTLAGARVAVGRSEVDAVEHRPVVAEEYERRSRVVRDEVDARWDL